MAATCDAPVPPAMPDLVRDRLYFGDINDAIAALTGSLPDGTDVTHVLSVVSSASISFFTDYRPGLSLPAEEVCPSGRRGFPSSNLVDLARSLSHIFGLDPPLFTRSVAAPPPPPNPAAAAPSPAPSPRPQPEAALYAPRPYRFPASPQLAAHPPPMEDPAEVFRRNAIAKLVDTADAAALRTAREAEVESLFAVQAELRDRGDVVTHGGVRRVAEEKEALEQRLQDVMMATDVLEARVAENRKGPAAEDDDNSAEGAIQPADALSRQMLECTATDLALEDAIYALDKAVQEGSMPFDGYLRSVRALAREQFFQPVLCTKVHSAQQQAQVARMAARAPPQYAS